MVQHLVEKGANPKVEFLSELKFMKAAQTMFTSVFSYKVQLTPEQFVQNGFSERKLILVLDSYDFVKQVKKQTKVHKRLNLNVDPKWEHPCDQAIKDYAVCDHKENVRRDMQFRINPTLLETKIEVKSVSKLEVQEQSPQPEAGDTKSVCESVKSSKS